MDYLAALRCSALPRVFCSGHAKIMKEDRQSFLSDASENRFGYRFFPIYASPVVVENEEVHIEQLAKRIVMVLQLCRFLAET